ncbi:hypothetical protein MRB53_038852 [Persea americana]|nr:hypothetical protein MRB53_038852 [Persea americana]
MDIQHVSSTREIVDKQKTTTWPISGHSALAEETVLSALRRHDSFMLAFTGWSSEILSWDKQHKKLLTVLMYSHISRLMLPVVLSQNPTQFFRQRSRIQLTLTSTDELQDLFAKREFLVLIIFHLSIHAKQSSSGIVERSSMCLQHRRPDSRVQSSLSAKVSISLPLPLHRRRMLQQLLHHHTAQILITSSTDVVRISSARFSFLVISTSYLCKMVWQDRDKLFISIAMQEQDVMRILRTRHNLD